MRAYKNIYLLSSDDHYNMLMQGESLASAHKEYRRIVREVAQAQTQTEEIDTLLKWKTVLTIDHKTGDRIDHDIKPMQSIVYQYIPKQDGKPYAGGLNEDGDADAFKVNAYGQTLHDLYMEVLQAVAYAFYKIQPQEKPQAVVVPISACDASDFWKYQNATKPIDE